MWTNRRRLASCQVIASCAQLMSASGEVRARVRQEASGFAASPSPNVTEPVATKLLTTTPPPTTELVATTPRTTEPAATRPRTTEPVMTKPLTTEPPATEPLARSALPPTAATTADSTYLVSAEVSGQTLLRIQGCNTSHERGLVATSNNCALAAFTEHRGETQNGFKYSEEANNRPPEANLPSPPFSSTP